MTDKLRTGPIAFGSDWPGVFIRGDDALSYAVTLRALFAEADGRAADLSQEELRAWMQVKELADLLWSCRAKERSQAGAP